MRLSTIVATAALFLCLVTTLPAETPVMPVEDIRPGMVGIGHTVFQGTEREEFKAHVLGVLRNVIGPRRDLILARLEGGPLAQTGVIAGMSGSPVYVDGKLIGAVAYSLGAFSKEPIAGITPIDEMTEAAALATPRAPAGRQARAEVPLTREALASFLTKQLARIRPFAERAGDVQGVGISTSDASQLATTLRPIATPLVMGGFTSDVFDMLATPFREAGFVPMSGGAATAPAGAKNEPLRPGDAVGVSLVSGDLELAATGTVTHVEGNRVYAFGHPFYNLGPTQFPMTRAYVYALLPSLFSSSKISGVGDVIGTVQQDRATTIAGTLGKGPSMIPVQLTLDTERGLHKQFNYQLVDDQLFTPLLTYVSILNTLRSYEREFGAATFTVKGEALVKGHGKIDFEDVFTGESPSMGAAAYVVAPISFLLMNDLAPVQLEGVKLSITSTEQPRTATIERVWLDDVRPRAGKTVPLKILTRTYRGEEHIETVSLDIPSNASGTLSVLVSDGSQLAILERRELRQPLAHESIPQIIRTLNRARKNNRLYVRLLSPNRGAVVEGESMTSLPPSVLAVYDADRSSGNVTPLRSAAIGEWEITTDHAISGSRLLTIDLDQE